MIDHVLLLAGEVGEDQILRGRIASAPDIVLRLVALHGGGVEDEEAFLAGMDLDLLFAGGVTRGGNGVGLANCAEVVAQCFGLADPSEAVQGGYLGAALRGDAFLVWFHWPAYMPHPEQTGRSGDLQDSRVGVGEPM